MSCCFDATPSWWWEQINALLLFPGIPDHVTSSNSLCFYATTSESQITDVKHSNVHVSQLSSANYNQTKSKDCGFYFKQVLFCLNNHWFGIRNRLRKVGEIIEQNKQMKHTWAKTRIIYFAQFTGRHSLFSSKWETRIIIFDFWQHFPGQIPDRRHELSSWINFELLDLPYASFG